MATRKLFYTVEINYKWGSERKMFRITNMDSGTLRQFRDNVFIGGAYRKVDADTGEIIPPWSITHIDVLKQAHFFNAVEEDKKLVNKK